MLAAAFTAAFCYIFYQAFLDRSDPGIVLQSLITCKNCKLHDHMRTIPDLYNFESEKKLPRKYKYIAVYQVML
jgi:hypothetical protein